MHLKHCVCTCTLRHPSPSRSPSLFNSLSRLGILEPTWDEFYGENSLFDNGVGPPFDDFFRSPDDDLDVFDVSAYRTACGGGKHGGGS